MKVKVVRSFSAFVEGEMVCGSEGQLLELPKGADWIRAGFVVPVKEEKVKETPAVEPAAAAEEPPAVVETVADVVPESASTGPSEAAVTERPRGRVMRTKHLRGEG